MENTFIKIIFVPPIISSIWFHPAITPVIVFFCQQLDDYDPRGSHSTRKRRKRRRVDVAIKEPEVEVTVASKNFELLELRKKKLRLECTKLELEVQKITKNFPTKVTSGKVGLG